MCLFAPPPPQDSQDWRKRSRKGLPVRWVGSSTLGILGRIELLFTEYTFKSVHLDQRQWRVVLLRIMVNVSGKFLYGSCSLILHKNKDFYESSLDPNTFHLHTRTLSNIKPRDIDVYSPTLNGALSRVSKLWYYGRKKVVGNQLKFNLLFWLYPREWRDNGISRFSLENQTKSHYCYRITVVIIWLLINKIRNFYEVVGKRIKQRKIWVWGSVSIKFHQ